MGKRIGLIVVSCLFFLLTACSGDADGTKETQQPVQEEEPITNDRDSEKKEPETGNEESPEKSSQVADEEFAWKLSYKGDPGVRLGQRTHLPDETLHFDLHFSRPVEKASVEERMLERFISNRQTEPEREAKEFIDFSWHESRQSLTLTVREGEIPNDMAYHRTFDLSGAKSESGETISKEHPTFAYVPYPKQQVVTVNDAGDVERLGALPHTLQVLDFRSKDQTFLLARWPIEGTDYYQIIPYLYDFKRDTFNVWHTFESTPFFAPDGEVYVIKDNGVARVNREGEKEWAIERPYMHGFSISPDGERIAYLYSDNWSSDERADVEVTLVVENRKSGERRTFPGVMQANQPSALDGSITLFQMEWIPYESQILVSHQQDLTGSSVVRKLNLENGQVTQAPQWMQSEFHVPRFSPDGTYAFVPGKGVYDRDGRLLHEWPNVYQVTWHSEQPILAYQQSNQLHIVDMDNDSLKTVDRMISPLGWDENGRLYGVERELSG